jgi:hypothetical protein
MLIRNTSSLKKRPLGRGRPAYTARTGAPLSGLPLRARPTQLAAQYFAPAPGDTGGARSARRWAATTGRTPFATRPPPPHPLPHPPPPTPQRTIEAHPLTQYIAPAPHTHTHTQPPPPPVGDTGLAGADADPQCADPQQRGFTRGLNKYAIEWIPARCSSSLKIPPPSGSKIKTSDMRSSLAVCVCALAGLGGRGGGGAGAKARTGPCPQYRHKGRRPWSKCRAHVAGGRAAPINKGTFAAAGFLETTSRPWRWLPVNALFSSQPEGGIK